MPAFQLKQVIKPFVPSGLIELNSRRHHENIKQREIDCRQRFEGLRNVVSKTVTSIAALSEEQCLNARFLENEFIPSLGLNDENLHEQPVELSQNFGKGLHIWQYPSQLAAYLVWLSKNVAEVKSYMEIGCRWGGMFILVSEWIRKNGAQLRAVTAVDPIKPTPFIEAYFDLLKDRSFKDQSPIQATYLCDFSNSSAVADAVEVIRPDFIFVDGDHGLRGALADHMLVRKNAKIIVHHDVCSQACPDTTFLWKTLKQLEASEFECFDFVSQYQSVSGSFLGIGAMRRKVLS
jgi:hypothetical protein